jgi:TRAP transporter TAXI family solute receptor
MRRRSVLLGPALSAAAAGLAACGGGSAPPARYHDGRLYIGTGNTTGVYYLLGGAFADLVTRNVAGFEARAEPTNASVENIRRIVSADMQMGFTQADAAADAVAGRGAFQGKPQRVTALARLYENFMQAVVRVDPKIRTVADLRGKRVSTGSPGSGTEAFAIRILGAAGLDADRDVTRQALSLGQTTSGMKDGSLDAMFFCGGLPTPGIADLMTAAPGRFQFLPLDPLLAPLNEKFSNSYSQVAMPKTTYNTPADTATLAVSNLLLAAQDMPADLASQLTGLLFAHGDEMAAAHPEARNIKLETARDTGSVPLHEGAKRFYDTA